MINMKFKLRIKKRSIVTALILLVLLITYNVLYFVIPFNRAYSNGAFWVTYGFTTFLILFMAAVVFIGIGDKEIKSRVFGVPIIFLGFSTLIMQFVIDAVVMGVGNFFEIKTWIPIIVETLLLAFFFISLIARTAYKDTIRKIDAQSKKTEFIKEFRINVEAFYNELPSGEFKKEFEKICEMVKYADPVSDKNIVEVEDSMSNEFEELKKAYGDGDIGEAKNHTKALCSLLNERKLRARTLK